MVDGAICSAVVQLRIMTCRDILLPLPGLAARTIFYYIFQFPAMERNIPD